jgi:hypothetical protein
MRVVPKVINKLSGDFYLRWYLSFLDIIVFGLLDACVRDISNETKWLTQEKTIRNRLWLFLAFPFPRSGSANPTAGAAKTKTTPSAGTSTCTKTKTRPGSHTVISARALTETPNRRNLMNNPYQTPQTSASNAAWDSAGSSDTRWSVRDDASNNE